MNWVGWSLPFTYIYIYVCLNALTMHGYSCAYARAIQLLLYEFAALQHRGCQASDLGKALAQALKCTACFVYFAFFFVPDTKSGGPSCMGGCRRPQTLLDYWPLDVCIYMYIYIHTRKIVIYIYIFTFWRFTKQKLLDDVGRRGWMRPWSGI